MSEFIEREAPRLGRLPPIPGLVVPKIEDYRKRATPPPPPRVDNYSGVAWRPFKNLDLGCCTIAAIAGGILQRTTMALGTPVVMPDDMVEQIYFSLTGGPDSGLVETDVLAWFAKNGVHLRDQTLEIATWAKVDHDSLDALRQGVYEFGSVYAGFALPSSAQSQTVWDVGSDPDSWGGHCALIVGYDQPNGRWQIATWGTIQEATDAFILRYLDEAYVQFSIGEWLGTSGSSPASFDVARLNDDLARLRVG